MTNRAIETTNQSSHPGSARRRIMARVSAALLFLLIAVVAYTQNQSNQPPKMTVTKVKGDLYEIEGGGGNVALYVTSAGAVLVDAKNPGDPTYDALMAQIKTVTNLPVKYVFNTHYHEDHTGANGKFISSAEVISTENSRLNTLGPAWRGAYGEHRVPPITPSQPSAPATTVFTQEVSIFLGGKEVRARYFGRGHTNGDAVIYFPAERAIHTGDMVTRLGNAYGPMVDYDGGGSIVDLTKTLYSVVAQLDFDTVIPGHGPVIDRAGMITYIKGVEDFRTRAAGLIRAGKSQEEVGKILGDEYNWTSSRNLNFQWTLPGLMKELK